MDVDQDVIKLTTGTAITTCHNSLNQFNNTKEEEENDKLIIIDNASSESSSSDESVEVINQYKLNDIRPIIGHYSKCSYILKYI